MIAAGVDLVEVGRLRRSIDRFGQRFLSRIFTEQEQRTCAGSAERLAGRFAIKEAVGKALGTGIGDVSWREIEVVNAANGRPELHLHGSAKRIAHEQGLDSWSISLAHTESQAIGLVVAMRSEQSQAEGCRIRL